MTRASLADTLTALALGALPEHDHLVVEEAEISLPLLVRMEHGPDGPRFLAQPPWSAFRAGFEPVTHRARLRVGTHPADPSAEPMPPAAGAVGPARPVPARADPRPPARPDAMD
jgi:hypothetical protein